MRIRLCEATIRDINRRYGNNPRQRRASGYKVRIKDFTTDPLYIVFEVTGGRRPYEVDLAFKDVAPKSRRAIQNAIKNNQIKVSCSCPDNAFRFRYYQEKDNYGFSGEHRPPEKTNPRNSLGPGCKHIAAVLGNLSWVNQLMSKTKEEEEEEL